MKQKERYAVILDYFRKSMPTADTELNFGNPFQLLVAVMLSAQCTDKRVNMVTPALFERYPSARLLAEATPAEVFEHIRSISYPNAKARHLVEMARMLTNDYGGEVPDTMEKLLTLPGVGRKTANVIMAVAYGKSAMAVDTHVYRVSHRLGLVDKKDNTPFKVEQKLVRNIPQHEMHKAHHWLLLHGRYTCTSRNPKCDTCAIHDACAEYRSSASASCGENGPQP
ncbi:MAG: endonuclease III [Prevotella sp.]